MKKILLLSIILILGSCSSSKIVRQSKRVIKGSWTLQKVNHNEKGTYTINLFNDASQQCFEGGSWQFISNNNSGYYTNCESSENKYFIFTIKEIDPVTGLYDFLLKPTNEKRKSQDNSGFRLRLEHLSETAMRWSQTVSVEGEPFTMYLNFTKNE